MFSHSHPRSLSASHTDAEHAAIASAAACAAGMRRNIPRLGIPPLLGGTGGSQRLAAAVALAAAPAPVPSFCGHSARDSGPPVHTSSSAIARALGLPACFTGGGSGSPELRASVGVGPQRMPVAQLGRGRGGVSSSVGRMLGTLPSPDGDALLAALAATGRIQHASHAWQAPDNALQPPLRRRWRVLSRGDGDSPTPKVPPAAAAVSLSMSLTASTPAPRPNTVCGEAGSVEVGGPAAAGNPSPRGTASMTGHAASILSALSRLASNDGTAKVAAVPDGQPGQGEERRAPGSGSEGRGSSDSDGDGDGDSHPQQHGSSVASTVSSDAESSTAPPSTSAVVSLAGAGAAAPTITGTAVTTGSASGPGANTSPGGRERKRQRRGSGSSQWSGGRKKRGRPCLPDPPALHDPNASAEDVQRALAVAARRKHNREAAKRRRANAKQEVVQAWDDVARLKAQHTGLQDLLIQLRGRYRKAVRKLVQQRREYVRLSGGLPFAAPPM